MKNLNFRLILKAGLIAGTLDILAACLNFYFKTGKSIAIVFKYIARAVFGKSAMGGGEEMVVAGILFHYVIAFIFTVLFALLFNKLWAWFQHTLLIAIIYGVFIWLVMNFLIVPNSHASQMPFSWLAGLTNCLILIICIGYPLTYIFRKNKVAI